MGSLSDQLLKAGLTNKGKAQQLKSEQRRKQKQQPKGRVIVDPLKVLAKQAEMERQKKDRELNRQQHEALLKKENQARVRQIIEQHCLEDIKGELEYNFVAEGKVKKLYLSSKVRSSLVKGSLSICALGDGFVLVPSPIAVKLHDLDHQVVIPLCDSGKEEAGDEDDPYADYQIPDDLIW